MESRYPNPSRLIRRTDIAISVSACGILVWGSMMSGCNSRPGRIRAIDVDPATLSRQVIEQCDTDGNGSLSESELQSFPPVGNSRAKFDTDNNGEVSAEELEARFTIIFNPQVGLLPASCRVTRNGKPLSGAEVRFVPPKMLEGVLPTASGVCDAGGTAWMRLAPEDLPKGFPNTQAAVIRPGIYMVEVTHPSIEIPPQYNKQTVLGKEVFSQILNGPPLPIELKF